MCAGNSPGIRARRRHCRRSGKQEIDLAGVARTQHLLFGYFLFPPMRERAVHVETGENGIDDAPRAWIVAQGGEFKTVAAMVGFDVGIDASRVRAQSGPVR